MRLDQELLEPMLSPIVSDISEIKSEIENHSHWENIHSKALHQTQILAKEYT